MNANEQSIYKRMQKFADLTNVMIAERNIGRIKKAFSVAEAFLQNGNNELKSAVLNVYLFSISSNLELQNQEGRRMLNYLPSTLRQAYYHQVKACYRE